MAYAVVKVGKMQSKNIDSLVRSVKLPADVENGGHVTLGAEVAGMNGVYTAAAPSAVTTQEVLLVEAPVIISINGYRIDVQDPTLFINKSGDVVRARHLRLGDEVTFSVDAFSSAPTVGQYAVPANGAYKLAPAADLSGGTKVAYQVEKEDDISVGQGFVTAYKCRVVASVG